MLSKLFLGNINQLKFLIRYLVNEQFLIVSGEVNPLFTNVLGDLKESISHFDRVNIKL